METVDQIVDYAYPTMMAERALRNLHEAMLEKKYDVAHQQGLVALTEVRMALTAIRIEMEKS